MVLFAFVVAGSAAFADPPSSSGPRVIRIDGFTQAVTWVDQRRGLRAVVGADIVEFCQGTIAFDVMDAQAVFLDTGAVVVNADSDMHTTSVWPFTAFDCDLFLSAVPLATGVSQMRYTDNDIFVSDSPNTNAYGWVAQGTLQDGDSNNKKFAGLLRCTLQGDADTGTVECAAHISLN